MDAQNQPAQSIQIEGFLLSPAQTRAWSDRAIGRVANNVVWVYLNSPINSKKICDELKSIVESDPQFATGFETPPGMAFPVQILDATTPLVQVHIFNTLDHAEQESEIERLTHLPLSRDNAPAFAISLLVDQQQTGNGVLILASAPFLADEASLLILLNRASRGTEVPLTNEEDEGEPLRFQHFSEWVNEEIRKPQRQKTQSSYGNPFHEITLSETILPVATNIAQQISTGIIPEDWLKKLNDRSTPESLLLTAWGLVAGQFQDEETGYITLSRLAAGRSFDDFAETIGSFAGRAPISIIRDSTQASLKVMAEIDQAIVLHEDAFIYYSDLKQIDQKYLGATVGFAWIATPSPGFPYTDVNIKPSKTGGNLDLIVEPMANNLRIRVVVSDIDADDQFAERLIQSTLTAVEYILLSPEAPLSSVPLVGMEEYKKVVLGWNDTEQLFALPSSIPDAFRQITQQQPTELAVVDSYGGLTFAEVDFLSEKLAHELIQRGVEKEAPVVVLASRSRESIISLLAIMKVSGTYIPVSPDFPHNRIKQILETINANLILANETTAEKVNDFGLDVLIVDAKTPIDGAIPQVSVKVFPEDAAYIIFTSGSTGVPKGVLVEHRSALNLWQGLKETVYLDSNPLLRVSVNAPFSFDASIKQILQILSGHTLYLVPADVRVDPKQLLAFLEKNRLDVLDCTPSLLKLLVDAGLGDSFSRLPQRILVGGEPFPKDLWNLLSSWRNTLVFNLYGPTEATVNTTAVQVNSLEKRPNIGAPLPNVRVYVLDPHGRPKMIGAPGELCIAGEGVARGYINFAEKADSSFTRDHFSDESGLLYRSGDKVCWQSDGHLDFLGRADHQVKLRGYRIELGDIDNALVQHPNVNDSVTIFRQEEDNPHLVSYVVLDPQVIELNSLDSLDIEVPSGHLIASINRHETTYLYQEIFLDRCYLRNGIILPPDAIVFDVGANIGMFSLFVASYAPKASIYAFEPLPPIHKRLRTNIWRYAAHQVKLFPEGLSDYDHQEAFTYYPGYSMMSGQAAYADATAEFEVVRRYLSNEQQTGVESTSLLLDNLEVILGEKFQLEEHHCQLRRLTNVLEELNVERIDLLKIDVQRAELDVLRGIDDQDWFKIKQVVLEVHDQEGGATEGHIAEIRGLLEANGFHVQIHQDKLLAGTDRFNCYAVRPGYAEQLTELVDFGTPNTLPISLSRASSQDLRNFLEQHLPTYMLPQIISLIDHIPLTSEGKIDYRSLPVPKASNEHREIVSPSTKTEIALIKVWGEILKQSSISVTDNFFQLGGDSIRSIQMQAMASDRGLSFSIRDLFQHPTVRELATTIDTESQAKSSPVKESKGKKFFAPFELIESQDQARLPSGLTDAYPMTSLQLSMIYLTQTAGDPRIFHNVTIHHVSAPLDPGVLQRTLSQVVNRHPILRTSFELTKFSQPLQLVWNQVNFEAQIEDLSHLDEKQRQIRLVEAMNNEHNTTFEFSTPPLLRVAAFALNLESYALLVAEHHSILDGWSLHTLIAEIDSLYSSNIFEQSFVQNELPSVNYRDFVVLENQATKDPTSTVFWLNELRNAPQFHLPKHLNSEKDDRLIYQKTVPTDLGALDKLRQLSAETMLPIRSLLLAVHLSALTQYTQQDNVVTGFVVSGRPEEPRADEILGLFLNIVPFYASTHGRSPIDLAGEAFEFERRLLSHRRYPLSEIRRQCGPVACFDSLFNFTQFHSIKGHNDTSIICDVIDCVSVDVDMSLAVDFQIDDSVQQLQISFQYDARRFSSTDTDEISDCYVKATEDLLTHPYQTISHKATNRELSQAEPEVYEIFQNVLGYKVDPHIGFLSAGGDSLSAVRAVCRLQQLTGHEIPLSIMAGNPTIEQISATITSPQKFPKIRKSYPLEERKRWVINYGRLEEPCLRLFVFPPAGASASIFEGWQEFLPKEIEVIALQYPGRQERLQELSITNMTDLVCGVVEAISPLIDLPFAMLGSSLGALVAFETARLLRSIDGVEPSFLFAVCARAPQSKESYPRFHAMTDTELIEALRSFGGVTSEILDNTELLNLIFPIVRSDSLVSSSYLYEEDQSFTCPITAVVGSQDHSVSLKQSAGWHDQTNGQFKLSVIDGGHSLVNTHKQELIKIVSASLQDILEKSPSRRAL